MVDENLIATLEQSLRQTRNAQNRLLVRLREVESEAHRLRQEIEALENSAAQTEQAIFSLLATMGSGKVNWNAPKAIKADDEYEADSHELARRRSMPTTNPVTNYPAHGSSVSYMNNSRHIPSISPTVEPISNRFTDRTITQACTLLLREHGRPLHVNELYNMLVAGGLPFTGNNPTISIAVSLNRNRRFRKVAPGTFDLVMRDASQTGS